MRHLFFNIKKQMRCLFVLSLVTACFAGNVSSGQEEPLHGKQLKQMFLEHKIDPRKVTFVFELDLQNSNLGVLEDEELTQLSRILSNFLHLQKLNIPLNNLGIKSVIAFFSLVDRMPNFVEINLACNGLGVLGAAAFAFVCFKMPNLRRINIDFNDLQSQGI